MIKASGVAYRQDGFTLLESLVALVILSFAIALVSEWIGTAQPTVDKIGQHLAADEIFEQSLDILSLQTFEQTRQGELNINQHRVEWRAELIKQSQDQAFKRQPNWNVALFNVSLDIYQGSSLITRINTEQVKQWQVNFPDEER